LKAIFLAGGKVEVEDNIGASAGVSRGAGIAQVQIAAHLAGGKFARHPARPHITANRSQAQCAANFFGAHIAADIAGFHRPCLAQNQVAPHSVDS
jgi:hypothetical protein